MTWISYSTYMSRVRVVVVVIIRVFEFRSNNIGCYYVNCSWTILYRLIFVFLFRYFVPVPLVGRALDRCHLIVFVYFDRPALDQSEFSKTLLSIFWSLEESWATPRRKRIPSKKLDFLLIQTGYFLVAYYKREKWRWQSTTGKQMLQWEIATKTVTS